MEHPVDLAAAFASFEERWSPRNVARLNDYDVRIAHVEGDHVWHVHEATDEMFLCLAGRFVVHLRDRDVVLGPGQLFVVPKGTEHKPEAGPGTRILMVEPRGTLTVGDRHEGEVSHLGVHAGIDVDAVGP